MGAVVAKPLGTIGPKDVQSPDLIFDIKETVHRYFVKFELSCTKSLSEKIMQLCNCFKMSTSQSGNIIFSEVSKNKPKDSYLLQFTIFSSLNSCRTPYVANSVLPNLAKVDQDNEHDLLTLSSGTVIRLQVEDCTYESKIFENPPCMGDSQRSLTRRYTRRCMIATH